MMIVFQGKMKLQEFVLLACYPAHLISIMSSMNDLDDHMFSFVVSSCGVRSM